MQYEIKDKRLTEGEGHDEQVLCRAPFKKTAVHEQRRTRTDKRVTEDA